MFKPNSPEPNSLARFLNVSRRQAMKSIDHLESHVRSGPNGAIPLAGNCGEVEIDFLARVAGLDRAVAGLQIKPLDHTARDSQAIRTERRNFPEPILGRNEE